MLAALFSLILGSVTPVNLSDGSLGFLIRCDGSGQTSDTCRMFAGLKCGEFGYRLINAETEKSAESKSSLGIAGKFGLGSSKSNSRIVRSMLVRCGKDAEAEAKWIADKRLRDSLKTEARRNQALNRARQLSQQNSEQKSKGVSILTAISVMGLFTFFVILAALR